MPILPSLVSEPKSPDRPFMLPRSFPFRSHLLAGAAVAEAAGALGNLLLSNGNDVDGDGVELHQLISPHGT